AAPPGAGDGASRSRRRDRPPGARSGPGPPAAPASQEAQAGAQGPDRQAAHAPHPRHHRVIALIQRVAEASVSVGGETVGAIGTGILALVGVERGDADTQAERLAERVLGYRIFADAEGRMNRSLLEAGGALLALPQFTLVADTRTGSRPS